MYIYPDQHFINSMGLGRLFAPLMCTSHPSCAQSASLLVGCVAAKKWHPYAVAELEFALI